jgi:sulfur transfer protein SufE
MYISDLGIKVYLKKIKFGALRDETLEFHLAFEAKILNDYAKILIEMLSGETEDRITSIDDLLQQL